jgi:hypothetical protein
MFLESGPEEAVDNSRSVDHEFSVGMRQLPTKSQSLYVTRCGSGCGPGGRYRGRRQSQQSLAGGSYRRLTRSGWGWRGRRSLREVANPLSAPTARILPAATAGVLSAATTRILSAITLWWTHGDLSSLLGQIATERDDRELKAKNNHAFCLPQFVGDW